MLEAAAAAWGRFPVRELLESSCLTVRLADGRRGAETIRGASPALSAAGLGFPPPPPPPPAAAEEALVGGRLGEEKDPCGVLDRGSRIG